MKHALIAPMQPVQTGYRVAQVSNETFDISTPFFWVNCADNVLADQFWYDPSDQTIKPVPVPDPPLEA